MILIYLILFGMEIATLFFLEKFQNVKIQFELPLIILNFISYLAAPIFLGFILTSFKIMDLKTEMGLVLCLSFVLFIVAIGLSDKFCWGWLVFFMSKDAFLVSLFWFLSHLKLIY